jgi:hypothetical protein
MSLNLLLEYQDLHSMHYDLILLLKAVNELSLSKPPERGAVVASEV